MPADAAQNILHADVAGFAGQSITTTRSPISCEESLADRVNNQCEHDRYRGGPLAQCSQHKLAVGQNYVRREADEFCSMLTRQIQIGRTKAVIALI